MNEMLSKFVPKTIVDSIFDIRWKDMYEQGYRYIITDLDNTLVGAKHPLATPELIQWLKVLDEQGWKVVIVSNNHQLRVGNFADPLSVPYIHKARKPGNRAFKLAMAWMGADPQKTIMIGDQLMTDIFGGNRLGLHTVWVSPIAVNDEGFFTKINRVMERFVIARLKRKGYAMTKEDR